MFHPFCPSRRCPRGIWILWAALLTACGGGGGSSDSSAPNSSGAVTHTIGTEGGTVTGPDGVQVVIPPGALEANIPIGIARSSAGAPAVPAGFPAPAVVYEFTPHGIVFNEPVTIRLPSSSADNQVFMASKDGDWNDTAFTYSGGMAEFNRNGFSWSSLGINTGCTYNPNDPNLDVSTCVFPQSHSTVTTTPASALSPTARDNQRHSEYNLTQATTLHFTVQMHVQANCGNASATLTRSDFANGRWGSPVTVAQQTVNLAVSGPLHFQHADGSTSFDVAMTDQDNGKHLFHLDSQCTRNGQVRLLLTDIGIIANIAAGPPPVSFHIGGTLSGLAGTDLVLQNNAGDNLALAANGSFQFATPVHPGSPYSVTVLTPPSGQTCSMQNGSGNALADVTGVAVACTTVPVVSGGTPVWQGAAPLAANGAFPQLATDAYGYTMAVWAQPDANNVSHIWARLYSSGSGWSAAQRIDTGSGEADGPQLASDAGAGGGYFQAVWRQVDNNGIWRIYSSRFSGGWSPVSVVETSPYPAITPNIAYDANAHRLVAWWNQYDSSGSSFPGIAVSRFDPVTTQWSTATPISGGNGTDAFYPTHLAISSNGEAYAVWMAGVRVWSNHYSPGSGWGAAAQINSGTTYGDAKLAVDGNGHAIAVWAQFTDHNGTFANTVYASHASAGVWAPPEEIDTDYAADAALPQVALQANGDAMVVWTKTLQGAQSLWARAYAAGVWGTPQLLDPAATSDIRNQPKLALDGLGNAMLVWATQPDHSLRAQRYGALTGWAAATALTTTAAYDFQLAVDPQGNATTVWNAVSGGLLYNLYRTPPP